MSRTFTFGNERGRLMLYGEVFNLLNTANLVRYGTNLVNPAEFGQPSARFTQVFSSARESVFDVL